MRETLGCEMYRSASLVQRQTRRQMRTCVLDAYSELLAECGVWVQRRYGCKAQSVPRQQGLRVNAGKACSRTIR